MTLLMILNLGFAWGASTVEDGSVPPVNAVQPLKPLAVGRV